MARLKFALSNASRKVGSESDPESEGAERRRGGQPLGTFGTFGHKSTPRRQATKVFRTVVLKRIFVRAEIFALQIRKKRLLKSSETACLKMTPAPGAGFPMFVMRDYSKGFRLCHSEAKPKARRMRCHARRIQKSPGLTVRGILQ